MKRILIVDDAEINREVLKSIFEEQFEILEAENGEEAIEIIDRVESELCLIFLDLLMPRKTGIDVLAHMQAKGQNDKVPVIVITGESSDDFDVQAYEYGAADIIYKPFSRKVVTRRALNIMELYEKRNLTEKLLEERTRELRDTLDRLEEAYEKQTKNNDFLVNALSSVVEFRSLESGEHIKRVQELTGILLKNWIAVHPSCTLTQEKIEMIISASALHDIGKIGIADSILLKPGKLTAEEFTIMKTHTTIGCQLIEQFKQEEDDFYHYCYDIARYHHERFDGRGYPDGLKGKEIPFWAQIVSVVDVFDALVSPRVYKAAFSVDEAVDMIYKGECGVFNPEILDCFKESMSEIIEAVVNRSQVEAC